jgi:hypothetical protein
MRAVVGWYRAFIGLVSLVAAGTTQPCNDTATFLDEFGAKCSAWVGYNCSDEATLLAWGYTLAGLRSVRIGCPATCSTCAEAAAAAASPTPPLQWVAIPRHGASPPPLREMTLLSRQVPGQARREVVLWGGTTGTAMNGDLYKLQVTSGGADALWQKVPITSRTRPVARTQHASALQGGRYLIVCGGADAGHYLLNDVYRLDLDDAHATWEELSPNGVAPMSRRASTASRTCGSSAWNTTIYLLARPRHQEPGAASVSGRPVLTVLAPAICRTWLQSLGV